MIAMKKIINIYGHIKYTHKIIDTFDQIPCFWEKMSSEILIIFK